MSYKRQIVLEMQLTRIIQYVTFSQHLFVSVLMKSLGVVKRGTEWPRKYTHRFRQGYYSPHPPQANFSSRRNIPQTSKCTITSSISTFGCCFTGFSSVQCEEAENFFHVPLGRQYWWFPITISHFIRHLPVWRAIKIQEDYTTIWLLEIAAPTVIDWNKSTGAKHQGLLECS